MAIKEKYCRWFFSSLTLFSNFNIHQNHPDCLVKAQLPGPPLGAADLAGGGRAQESAWGGEIPSATSLRPKGLGSEHLGANLRTSEDK